MRPILPALFILLIALPTTARERSPVVLDGVLTGGELHVDCKQFGADLETTSFCGLWVTTTFQGLLLGAAYALFRAGLVDGGLENAFPLAMTTIGVCPDLTEPYPVMAAKFFEFLDANRNLHDEVARYLVLAFLREEYPCS